jgi:hypothetical protein
MHLLSFQWDEDKARRNLLKHGVSFWEAASAFADPFSKSIDDPDHGEHERRSVLLGLSSRGRHLVVGYTERGAVIRIITARKASRHERERYEEP